MIARDMPPPRIGGVSVRIVPAVIVAAVLLIVLVPMPGASAATVVPGGGGARVGGTSHPVGAPSAAALPAAAGPRASSGPGTFFGTTAIPLPSSVQNTCYFATCYNNSNNPSINLTTSGVLGIAYMAYTNQSPCANVSAYAQTEIGFVASTNGGGSWSTPIYLGNTNCAVADQYTDAWQPSLTSLANGTFVLAYIQYNLTPYTIVPYVNFNRYPGSGYSMTYSRLVVSESYNGGSTWTTPVALNTTSNPLSSSASWTPERPWVTAFGRTIYVAWMNETQSPGYNYFAYPPVGTGSSQSHLIVSTDGGATWGTPVDLNQVGVAGQMEGLNPNVVVAPSGEVFVAYATNYTFQQTMGVLSYVWTTDVEVAASTNNGSTFSYAAAASGVLANPYRWGDAADPSPQLAYSSVTGQLYLTFGGATSLGVCYAFSGYCTQLAEPDVYFLNSSTHGATWSSPHRVTTVYDGTLSSGGFNLYNPTLAVLPSGAVDLEMTYVNLTVCGSWAFGTACGVQYQIFLNTTDNGTTFSSPVEISGNATLFPDAPDGEYDTMIAAGAGLWMAWTMDTCPAVPVTACSLFYPGGNLVAQVQVSSPPSGPGLSLTYQEHGLPAGTPWNVNVLGNIRTGLAPTSLSLSGVVPGESLNWSVGVQPTSYGTRYHPNGSVSSPASFAATSTVYENFSEQVLVNVSTVPDIPQCLAGYNYLPCWDNSYFSTVNYNITPGVGQNWVDVGGSVTFNVTGPQLYCTYVFCFYTAENLSFQSWTGTGAGSVNTSQRNITITPAGPVNETANFVEVGWCYYDQYNVPAASCLASNASFVFHENHLPVGTNWTVTLAGPFGTSTESTTTAWLTFTSNATIGPVNYTVWTIPNGSSAYYVGTGSPLSPIELPLDHLVNVNFTSEAPSAATFATTFQEDGLPSGTAWTLNLSGQAYGERGASTSLALAGGSYTVGGSPVYLENSTGFYPANVTVQPLVSGERTRTYTTLPATITLNGSAIVTVGFAPLYLLTVTASSGGTATPPSMWVRSGQSVTLTATPDAGFTFVGWSGSGPGATSSSQRTQDPVTITPRGTVTELATFMPSPAAEWNVTVNLNGLPAGLAGTVGIGNRTLSGSGTFTAVGFLGGSYALTVPYVYLNSTDQTRFVPTSVATTFAPAGPGTVTIAANGYVNVTYGTQYLLSVAAVGSGTTEPAPGAAWYAAGESVDLTAVPNPGFELVSWTGAGAGAVNATTVSIAVDLAGPVTETAQFAVIPTPPIVNYNLTVASTGLPSGAAWSVVVSSTGASGTGTSLTVTGLNGTYTVSVPTVYTAPGVRYVPETANFSATVTAPGASASVAFEEQFQVTVSVSAGGSATPSSGWIAAGAAVNLSATAASGYAFDGWSGSGTGAYTGSAATWSFTPTGPVTESAAFSAIPPPPPAPASSSAGMPLDLGLLVGLLVAGLAVGWLVGRRRSGGAPPAASEEPPAE